jgi:hypothetical protein
VQGAKQARDGLNVAVFFFHVRVRWQCRAFSGFSTSRATTVVDRPSQ